MEKAQVIHYKCCDGVFAACMEPDCYEDKDWLKDLRKYSKDKFKISIQEIGGVKSLFGHNENCCNHENNKGNIIMVDKNQMSLSF